MADRSKFDWHIKQIENAQDTPGKLDALAAMLFTIATNDLACIEKRIRVIAVVLAAIGVMVLSGQTLSLPTIISFIGKLFGA